MSWMPIVTVHSRLLAFLLFFEFVALPAGFGFSIGAPLAVLEYLRHPSPAGMGYLAIPALGLAFLGASIWRPNHRRLGMKRDAAWVYERPQ